MPPFDGVDFAPRKNKALYKSPPIGTRGSGIDPRPERVVAHNPQRPTKTGIGVAGSIDGITLHLYK